MSGPFRLVFDLDSVRVPDPTIPEEMPGSDYFWHFRVLDISLPCQKRAWERGKQMSEIAKGTPVFAASADGIDRELRAIGGVTAGGDFAVIWVCTEPEGEAAEAGGRDPEGVPWPADD